MSPTTYRKLQDKHILIIGGSSGIGAAVAEAALSEGAFVTISSSSQSKIDSLITSLQTSYPEHANKIRGIRQDLLASQGATNPNDIDNTLISDLESIFQRALSSHSHTDTNINTIDHIIYTASPPKLPVTPLSTLTPSKIQLETHMRLTIPLILARLSTKYLAPTNQSSLTLTSGTTDTKPPTKGWSLLSYFAGGLVSLARGLAVDMAPIRVNVVRPGVVDTGIWDGILADPVERGAFKNEIGGRMLTGRIGRVEDVAEAYLWLMKDGNVTGSVAATDSGALLV